MPPKISIVVPVHNVAPYLPSCIESVIDQRHGGVEVVLIDDQSTDGSAAICDRYAAQHDEVRVLHLAENVGVAQARNQGLAAARGGYVLFLDGDDALTPGSLQRLAREIDRIGPVDVVICRYVSQSKVLSNSAMFLESKVGRKLERDVVLAHLTAIDFYLDHCWPYVISRALIERHDVRFIDSMIAEDAEYIVRILTLATSIAYCAGDFYLYRERAGSLKASKGAAATASFLQVAHAMQQVMDTVAQTDAQVKFVASQINHAFGVFATRLSLLDDAEVSDVGSQVTADHLPRAVLPDGSDPVAAALMSYREATERATESLVAGAKGRPVFIYCAGPSAEAVIGTLQRAQHDVRAVIDDNPALAGRRLLGVPIVTRSHLASLNAAERAAACIVVCLQKRSAAEKIIASLTAQGFARNQIIHRLFEPGVLQPRRARARAAAVSVLIAALNEQENIRAAVQTVIRAARDADNAPIEIIIVNDGSKDRTGQIADEIAGEIPFVRVVHHAVNLGQGAAIMDGLRLAKYDRLTMFPGDNELSYYTVRNLLANRHKADYVLAMIINTEYRPAYRILLSAIFSHIYTTTFGLPIKYINAPALWPIARLKDMGLRAQRYSLHGEINVKLLRQPITFLEIDGYMNPAVFKSSAVRLKNLFEVMAAFARLCFEIFVTKRDKYSAKATRVLPPGVVDHQLVDEERASVDPADAAQPSRIAVGSR